MVTMPMHCGSLHNTTFTRQRSVQQTGQTSEKRAEPSKLAGRDEPSYVFSPKQSETPRRPFYVVAYRNTTQSSIKAQGIDAM